MRLAKNGAEEGQNSDRRRFLKVAGSAVGAVTLPIEAVGAAVTTEQDGTTVTIRRPLNNPMTIEQANKIRRQAVDRFRDETGSTADVGYTQMEASHETDVFALSIRIDPAGQSAAYLGTALRNKETSQSTVDRLHSAADKFEKQAEQSVANVSRMATDRQSGISVASAALSQDWNQVDSFFWDYTYQDYGLMQTGTDAGVAVGEDTYTGAYSTHINSPGVNEFSDSKFRQYLSWMEQDHSVYDPGGMDLFKYAPENNDTGDTSYSGTIGFSDGTAGASISASYDPINVSRYDESVLSEELAAWRWDYNEKALWDGATKNPDTFEPNSIGRSPNSLSDYDELFEVTSEAQWYNPFSGNLPDKFTERFSYFNDGS